jgi:cytoskeletal protein CcmA (bactofilin family)
VWKKEESKPQGVPEISTTPAKSSPAPAPVVGLSAEPRPSQPASAKAPACISQGIRIKGEVTGSEDIFIDGNIEGKLEFGNASLTVGPNGRVKADISAREVIVRGKVDGKVIGRDKVQLWNTGQVAGEVQTERLAIEEGAVLRGKVEAGKVPSRNTSTKSSVSPASSAGTEGQPKTTNSSAATV